MELYNGVWVNSQIHYQFINLLDNPPALLENMIELIFDFFCFVEELFYILFYWAIEPDLDFLERIIWLGYALLIAAVIAFLILVAYVIIESVFKWLVRKLLTYHEDEVLLEVVRKNFVPEDKHSYYVFIPPCVIIPVSSEEKYELELRDESTKWVYALDDEELFGRIDEGDVVEATISSRFNKNGDLKDSFIVALGK